MNAGEIIDISNIGPATIYEPYYSNVVDSEVEKYTGSRIGDFAIEFELPVFDISFENNVSPSSDFDPTLSITNFSNTIYADIWISISSLVEGATVTLDNASDIHSTFSPFSTVSTSINYDISIGDVAYGSDITFLVEFMKNEQPIFSQEVPIHIKPASENLPVCWTTPWDNTRVLQYWTTSTEPSSE